MALYATNRFPGDGSTTSYEFNFVGKYIARTHVKVYQEDNATKVRTPIAITDSNFLNDTTLRSLPVTPIGKTLVIYRETPKTPMVDFTNGSRFTEYNMDLVARQGLFVAVEAMDAGDSDAREQLLAAIAVVSALVDDATAAVSDATAAALAAATSASNAAGSASAANTAKTAAQAAQGGAETARTGAETAAGNAATFALAASNSATAAAGSATTAATQAGLAAGHVTSASTQATNAANSATAAAGSASTATTQAGNAATSASAASTQATNAANSATAAAGSASAASTSATNAATSATDASNSAAAAAAAAAAVGGQGRMCCRVMVTNAANRTLTLQRCGGQTMSINGVPRTIPAAGVSINVSNSSTAAYLYAVWNGSAITLSESSVAPTFDLTLGQWIYPGIPNYTPVAFFRGNGLVTPERFLRNYYNAGPATFTSSLASDYSASWDGVDRQLITMPILLMPGDTIDVTAQANIVSGISGPVGDLTAKIGGGVLCRARNTHAAQAGVWQNYSARAVIQRGSGTSDPAQEAVFELWYLPISTFGSSWTALGSGGSGVIVRVDPYRWA